MSTHLVLPHPYCLETAYQRQKSPPLYLRKLLVQLLSNLEQHHHVRALWEEGVGLQGDPLTLEKGSNTSTPTTRSEGVQDWAVADVQEFVPQGFEHVVSRPCPLGLLFNFRFPSPINRVLFTFLTIPISFPLSLPASTVFLSSSLPSRWCWVNCLPWQRNLIQELGVLRTLSYSLPICLHTTSLPFSALLCATVLILPPRHLFKAMETEESPPRVHLILL